MTRTQRGKRETHSHFRESVLDEKIDRRYERKREREEREGGLLPLGHQSYSLITDGESEENEL